MGEFNQPPYNQDQYNQAPTDSFWDNLDKKRDSIPRIKVEFITKAGVSTDISKYYDSGATIERIKERAPDEIQAGDFDIVLFNHDDTFSEYKATSLLYGVVYHGAKIKIYAGFQLSTGEIEYHPQITGYIDELLTDPTESKVTLRCRDGVKKILDAQLFPNPIAQAPVPGSSNAGTGTCSSVETKPFKTINETWTLLCTLGGSDSVATFSVTGSVSGVAGVATSGTQFSTGEAGGGVRFIISAGDAAWVAGDSFTFTTSQHPEWSAKNPIKIIWEILTGYSYDSGTALNFSSQVLSLDHTQDSTNPDINFTSFQMAVSQITDSLSGYVDYQEGAVNIIGNILLLYLGTFFTDADGKINIKVFQPTYAGVLTYREFADSKKITELSYDRSIGEVNNTVVVKYKASDSWEFTLDEVVYDGTYTAINTTSVSEFGTLSVTYNSRWFSSNGAHASNLANFVITKYADPPLVVTFTTGLDAIDTDVGTKIFITDTKSGFSRLPAEVSRTVRKFDAKPTEISITARRDSDIATNWGFLGSSADEGDGFSPQASSYSSATSNDKTFCYLGASGVSDPDYRMF